MCKDINMTEKKRKERKKQNLLFVFGGLSGLSNFCKRNNISNNKKKYKQQEELSI